MSIGNNTEHTAKMIIMPLDERPCNYHFPYRLVRTTDVEPVRPPLEWMGRKKEPADTDRLWTWTDMESQGAAGAVLSLDTLLYGGIVPSRLHELSTATIAGRLSRLRELKANHPELIIYAFQLIMRCPQYSSSDEEPDYYADWGREIFRKGYLEHLSEHQELTAAEQSELDDINSRLPQEVLDDYLGRRAVNREANRLALEYVADGTIDFLIFPQDDSAPYGYTARDQQRVRAGIRERQLGTKVYMYPGADEVGCTLIARMLNTFNGYTPRVYPRFGSVRGPQIVPAYEDRPLLETLKYQIIAAGGMMVSSQQEADVVLLLNTPGERMGEAVNQGTPSPNYDTERGIVELVEYAAYLMRQQRAATSIADETEAPAHSDDKGWRSSRSHHPVVAVADIAYANGGDLELLDLLRQQGILYELGGYAGWNTSSNTLGTVIAQSMLFAQYGHSQRQMNFLALRYVEDFGYDSIVRKALSNGPIQELGLDKFNLDGPRGHVSVMVKEGLEQFIAQYLTQEGYTIDILDCYMPWNRMFEVGLSVKARQEQ
ncbi:DUF4127 family protein [Paenibacillus hunanensis]|uniref:DUF4127 family protein n=1 Tax=Paenibacillus hunanensis TaxID=539262 RepID=UPI002A6A204D|nr:DUF4127 family protein [Paenibacillus hunanensis]WPP41741.1 DUF4127 family protein [Paenibacillus hunanensis]